MNAEDSTLVEKTLGGDKAGFDELVQRYSRLVFKTGFRFFSDRQSVEDIAQETFLQAYCSLGTYSRKHPFGSWLMAIALRICFRSLKEQKRRAELDSHVKLNEEEFDLMERFFSSPWSAAAVDQGRQALCRDLVDKVLCRLSAREHVMLVLTEVEGYSVKEAAKLMGLTVVNAKVSAFRARRRALGITKELMKTGHKKAPAG